MSKLTTDMAKYIALEIGKNVDLYLAAQETMTADNARFGLRQGFDACLARIADHQETRSDHSVVDVLALCGAALAIIVIDEGMLGHESTIQDVLPHNDD